MALAGRDLVTIDDLSDTEVTMLLDQAKTYVGPDDRPRPHDDLHGRIVATLFFEPSTRTRLSFETAAHRLDAGVIGFADAGATSAKKGETLTDTVRMADAYADLIVLRHPEPGSARAAADAAQAPLVNAGDGGHEHPTQALLDLYTIREERGRTGDNHVVLLGDLKYGRTVHSLAKLLVRFGDRVTCVAPEGLGMPKDVLDACGGLGARPTETTDVADAVKDADVVYATRIQQERFPNPAAYKAVAGAYRVDKAFLAQCPDDVTLMHPLPRVDEIATEVDALKNAAYFRQARNAVPVRMALLAALLGASSPKS